MNEKKLDQWLSTICELIGEYTLKILIVLAIIETIEQIVMHFNLNQMLAVFLSASAIGVLMIEEIIKKMIEKKEEK